MRFTNGVIFFAEMFLVMGIFFNVTNLELYCKPGEPYFRSCAFILRFSDSCALARDLISESIVNASGDCAHNCLAHVFCSGYSFNARQINGKPNCQLTNAWHRHMTKISCDTMNKGWLYYQCTEPKKVKCSLKSCENGGVIKSLSNDATSDAYICMCPDEFGGELCETKREVMVTEKDVANTISYSDGVDNCASDGKKLCSSSEVCKDGKTPFSGVLRGDHWSPVRDSYNEWVQIGQHLHPCIIHTALNRKPQWGLTNVARRFKGKLFCCEYI